MTDVQVAQAGNTLKEALLRGDNAARAAALEALNNLLTVLLVDAPQDLHETVRTALAPGETRSGGRETATSALGLLMGCLGDRHRTAGAVMVLLRLLRPAWICGAWDVLSYAPPFSEAREKLFCGLDSGIIDISGLCAVLIGMYGPEAEGALDELLCRLDKSRTDCTMALPLTWAVYQIGGMSPAVRDALIAVARDEHSCPHARPVAQKILAVNEVSY